MQYNEIVNLVGNMGFPIGITIYVLIRLESKMDKLNESINKLTNVIDYNKEWLKMKIFCILFYKKSDINYWKAKISLQKNVYNYNKLSLNFLFS